MGKKEDEEVKAVNALIKDLQDYRKKYREASTVLRRILYIHDTVRPKSAWRVIFSLFSGAYD